MNKRILQAITILTSVAVVVVAASHASPVIVTGGLEVPTISVEPQITIEPTNLMIEVGADTQLSVTKHEGWHYQWLRNGIAVKGKTHSSLKLENVQADEAGYYSCMVDTGLGIRESDTASMQTYVVIDPDPDVVVYALPIVSNGGSGSCPGPYKGYSNYFPPTGWGWVPYTNTTLFTATDTNRTNTKVVYTGMYGDIGCGKTTVTLTSPLYSPQYVFTVYFTNSVPTNPYPLCLVGFDLP